MSEERDPEPATTEPTEVVDPREFTDAQLCELNPLLNMQQIALLLGVTKGTVQLWNSTSRGILPPPNIVLSRVPFWRYLVIREWSMQTGRWKRQRVNRYDVPRKGAA